MCSAKSLVLCEGPSDEDFIEALKAVRGGLDHIVVSRASPEEDKGWGAFKDRLLALSGKRNIGNYKAIVLFADCDGDPQERTNRIQDKVSETQKYSVPDAAWMASVRNNFPPIHIITVPGKNEPGCLETLLIRALVAHMPGLAACAEAYFQEVDKFCDTSLWSVSNKEKLRLRLQLAALQPRDPLIPFSKIWKRENESANYMIDLRDPCFDSLVRYLKHLA